MRCEIKIRQIIVDINNDVSHVYKHRSTPPEHEVKMTTELFISPVGSMRWIYPLLLEFQNLSSLEISSCLVYLFPSMIEMLKQNPNIKDFKIGYLYDEAPVADLENALAELKHLEHLKIDGDDVIINDLSRCLQLKTLSVSRMNDPSCLEGLLHLESITFLQRYNTDCDLMKLITSCEKLEEIMFPSTDPLPEYAEEALEAKRQRNKTRRTVMGYLVLITQKGNRDVIHEIIKNLRI